MALDCAIVMKENSDMHLSRLGAALRANYIVLITCALMILGALLMSFALMHMVLSTVRSYYALLPTNTGANIHKKARSKTPNADDNMVYADDLAAAGLASNLQDSDNSRIKASITALKGRYSQYNTAMTDYATRVQNRTADDLMDEQILSRGNDDFVYSSQEEKN